MDINVFHLRREVELTMSMVQIHSNSCAFEGVAVNTLILP